VIDILVDIREADRPGAIYVLDLWMSILGLAHRYLDAGRAGRAGEDGLRGDVLLYYGDLRDGRNLPGRNCVAIQSCSTEGEPDAVRFLDRGGWCLPVLFWKNMDLPGVPLIRFDDSAGPAAVSQEEDGPILVSADLIRTCFDLLSRREEMKAGHADEFGRFPSARSLAHRRGFLRTAVVDAAADLIGSLVVRLFRAGRIPCLRTARWPGCRRWALCLSHDVDWVRKWTWSGTANYLLRGTASSRSAGAGWLQRMAAVWRDLRAGRDPYDNLGDIVRLESKHGAVSTFFFLPGVPDQRQGGRKILGGYPGRFDLAGQTAAIRQAGGEAELHGSFDSYDDENQLARERQRLGRRTGSLPRGIRQHFLRYRFPSTARCHQKAGLEYDSTLGFGDRPGYRCGTSFPYQPFDPSAGGPVAVTEIPLVIMDGALEIVRGGTMEASRATVDQLLDQAERWSGLCTVLWHNTSFAEIDDGGLLRDLYLRALHRARSSEAWVCSCGQLLDWWRWRSNVMLQELAGGPDDDRRWRLHLPDGDRSSVVMEFLIPGDRRLKIDGGRSRMLSPESERGEGWLQVEVFDWNRQDLTVQVIRR
jgi:peptidoglycan/xylan/chitin deacetylase (PgdA/CDA1 family)